MSKKKPPQVLFKSRPNKRPHGRVRASTGEFESFRSGGARRTAKESQSEVQQRAKGAISGAAGAKLTRKTRAGLMAQIHAEAEDVAARKRDAVSTALVRDLRRINHARSQPFGPPDEQIEESPDDKILVLSPEQKAVQMEHFLAWDAANREAYGRIAPLKLKGGKKGIRRGNAPKKPRDVVRESRRGEIRILDADGQLVEIRKPRRSRDAAAANALVEELRASSERRQRGRDWRKHERPDGVTDLDWEILRLTEVEELKAPEIAVKLGLTPDAARQRLSRLRKRLNP